MQYHLDGFQPGDPELFDAAPGRDHEGSDLPAFVDVLIVGCGPAGLTLAAQLAAFPEISTRIVERKSGPIEKGQADGISCRSMEMFNAFGFAEKVMKQGYWVNETTFWKPDGKRPDRIVRNGRIQDVEDGLSPTSSSTRPVCMTCTLRSCASRLPGYHPTTTCSWPI